MQLMEGRPRPGSHPQGRQPEGEDTYESKRAEKKVRRIRSVPARPYSR